MTLAEQLERCDRELALHTERLRSGIEPDHSYGALLAIKDWAAERELILEEMDESIDTGMSM